MKKALTYGNYTLTELTNKATAGKDPVEMSFEIKDNGFTVYLGTITEDKATIKNKKINIGTTLISDETGTKTIPAGKTSTLTDTVAYKGLTVAFTKNIKIPIGNGSALLYTVRDINL